jgi:hypothetical protein
MTDSATFEAPPLRPAPTRERAYAVFGGVLHSDLDFPELREATLGSAASWTLRTAGGAPPPLDAAPIGEEDFPLYGSSLRLFRTPAGFRLAYSDSGIFDVSADGRDLVWYPPPDAPLELVRMDVVGRVLATALHAAGAIALHASAVAIGGTGVAFLAPKFFGKSTLALALTYAGARLITDDTLGVIPGEPPMCIPGVHSVRLRSESAARFPRTRDAEPAGGRVVDELPDEKLMTERVPLSALYLLSPVDRAQAAEPVRRVPLPSFQGTIAVLGHAKMGSLFRESEATANFERAAAVTRALPVYQLEIVRDLDQLDEVTRCIIGWHADERPPAGH